MSHYDPETFVELANHLEQTLQHHRVFFCRARPGHGLASVQLVALNLKEVHFKNQGVSGVYMQFEALFDTAGRGVRTVKAVIDFMLFAHLRVTGVTLGRGTVQAETGYIALELTCEVSREALRGPMRADVDIFRKKNAAERLVAGAVKAERSSTAYKAGVAELKQVERELRALQKKQARLTSTLTAREAAAVAKGTPPFKVVIA